MAWKKIENHTPIKREHVLLWGGVIKAEHTGDHYAYSTPVKAFWDGEDWLLSDSIFYDGFVLTPTHVRSLPKPPKA